jgi:hypothetical protein
MLVTCIPAAERQRFHRYSFDATTSIVVSICTVYHASEVALRPTALPRFPRMCYNLRTVQPATKQVPTYDAFQPDHSMRSPNASTSADAPYEHASHYCPVCSQRLESRRCKLICAVCGYYMSCADYY